MPINWPASRPSIVILIARPMSPSCWSTIRPQIFMIGMAATCYFSPDEVVPL